MSSLTGNETILVVDDKVSNLKLVDRILKAHHFENNILVEDPRMVVNLYEEVEPDLILLDLNMPYLNGFEVIEQLKSFHSPLDPPIIVLTAQSDRELMLKALSFGARDYISKPFDQNELMMRVRNLLEAQLAHRMLYNQKSVLEEMVDARTRELQETRLEVVQRLGMAAEYRDEETGNHILRMSHSCALLAEAIGWDDRQCDLILNASPMHDIGKIGIPDVILLKPGKLDPEEWEIMKTHVTIGGRLLDGNKSDLLVMARDIALSHHEKWDGTGYPSGLSGESIPQAGRIAALADVFDALTSRRPYKKAWPIEDAISFILDNKGKHFEPRLVDVFMDLLPNILDIRSQFSDE